MRPLYCFIVVVAFDIAGGQDGSVYIITVFDGQLFPAKWNGNSQTFDQVSTPALIVGVAPDGRPWIFASETFILRAK